MRVVSVAGTHAVCTLEVHDGAPTDTFEIARLERGRVPGTIDEYEQYKQAPPDVETVFSDQFVADMSRVMSYGIQLQLERHERGPKLSDFLMPDKAD